MAELGDIPVVQVGAGTRPVDRTSESRALVGALNVAGKVVDEAVEGSLVNALGEIEENARNIVAEPGAESEAINPLQPGLNKEALPAFYNIQRLTNAADQATNSSQRSRAILKMQDALRDAKTKWPWASDQLDSAASKYMSNNPTLTRLGAYDTAVTAGMAASQKAAADDIEDIKNYAQTELGMDPALYPFDSVGFSNEYAKRSADQQSAVVNELALKRIQGNANASGEEALREWGKALEAPGGDFSQGINQIQNVLNQHRIKGRTLEAAGDLAGLAAHEDNFTRNTLDTIVKAVAGAKVQIERQYSATFSGNEQLSTYGQQGRKMADQAIEDLDIIVAAAQARVTDIADLLDTQSRIRSSRRLQEVPSLRTYLDIMREPGMEQAVKLMVSFDKSYMTPEFQQLISNGLTHGVSSMLSNTLRTTSETDPSADALGRAQSRQTMRMLGTSGINGVATNNDPVTIVATSAETVDYYLEAAKRNIDIFTPTSANGVLNDIAGHLESYTIAAGRDGLDTSLRGRIYSQLASDELFNLVEKAGGSNTPAYQDLVNVATDTYLNSMSGPDSLANHTASIRNLAFVEAIPGTKVSLLDLVEIDTSELVETGTVKFNLIDEAYKNALPASRQLSDISVVRNTGRAISAMGFPDVPESITSPAQRILDTLPKAFAQDHGAARKQELIRMAGQLGREVTEHIRVNALLDMQVTSGKRDFEMAAVNSGLVATLRLNQAEVQ